MKKRIFAIILIVWVVLWMFFLVREDKDGQYRMLKYFDTHSPEERVSFLVGDDLYDFLVFCRKNISPGATYELLGFEEFSIKEVRARYLLWPLKSVAEDPDFMIVYGEPARKVPGYKEYRTYGNTGLILARKEAVR